MNTQFFSSKIISKIVVLFGVVGVMGFTGFTYVTSHNQEQMPKDIAVAQASTKNIGAYIHIRKPGESGFRKFSSADF